jgi:hypothetical protein
MAAAEFICTATGVRVDSISGTVSIGLTDTAGAFNRTSFSAAAAMRREMLAIGLAAISTGSQVLAVLDSDTFGPRRPRKGRSAMHIANLCA